MDGFLEWARMGGYAAFVWPAYGVALLVLGGMLVASLRSLRRREDAVARLERDRPRRARPAAEPLPSNPMQEAVHDA